MPIILDHQERDREEQLAPAAPSLEEMFEALYEQYRVPLLRYVRSMIGNPEDAEDLIQDTFLKAYKALPSFASASTPATSDAYRHWLFVIARNTLYDALRRRRGKELIPWEQLVSRPAAALQTNVAQFVANADLLERLWEQVPERTRRALLLRLEGYSCRQIAQQFQATESSIKSLLWRVQRRFAHCWHEYA